MSAAQRRLANWRSGPAPRRGSRRANQRPVKTAKAACRDGQALPAASVVLRNAMAGWRDQSMSGTGMMLGQNRKIVRPTTERPAQPRAKPSSSRRSMSRAGRRAT